MTTEDQIYGGNVANCALSDPSPFIYAQQNRGAAASSMLPEAVDNSIDGNATTIDVGLETKKGPGGSFWVEDNGCGVASLAQLMSYGTSTKTHDGTTVGRYGVGAKELIWGVGGLQSTLHVHTATKTKAWYARVPWSEQTSFEWPWQAAEVGTYTFCGSSKTGTRLRVVNCYKRLPTASELMNELRVLYWPWLCQKKNRLRINNVQVKAPDIPVTDNRFCNTVMHQFPGERTATLEGGLTPESHAQDALNGVTVWCGNRSIYAASPRGLHSRNSVFVLVRLQGPWQLETNKNGLSEAHAEELDEWLYEHLADLANEAQAQTMRISVDDDAIAINQELNELEEEVFGLPVRPERHGDTTKRTRGRGEPRQIKEAAQVDDTTEGTTKQRSKKRRSNSSFHVEFMDGPDSNCIGVANVEQRMVTLHTNNPAVAMLQGQPDMKVRRLTLKLVACSLWAHRYTQKTGQLDYATRFGQILNAAITHPASMP